MDIASSSLGPMIGEFEEMIDYLPHGSSIRQPNLRTINIDLSESESLKEIWKNYGRKRQKEFILQFGHIAYLASIKVDVGMIKAMIKFWDPAHRCFTFGKFDLTPTLEEYATMIYGEEVSLSNNVFRPYDDCSCQKALQMATGIEPRESARYFKRLGEGNDMCIPMTMSKELIAKPESKTSTLALALYGAILFPKTKGHVRKRVLHFFSRMIKPTNAVNPVCAILAETIMTLNHCSRTGTGKFEGCSQLLFIWIMGHLPAINEFGYNKLTNYCPILQRKERNPILRFIPESWPENKTTMHEWVQYFIKLEEVVWRSAWMRRRPFILSCDNLCWVPLIGISGVVSYAPSMVLRQLGYNQYVPAIDGLSDYEFSCKWLEDKRELKSAVDAWISVTKIEGPIGNGEGVSDGYDEWHKHRGNGFTAPPVLSFVPKHPPVFLNSHDYITEEKAKYQVIYDGMKIEKQEMILRIEYLETKLSQENAKHREERREDHVKYRQKVEEARLKEKTSCSREIGELKNDLLRLNHDLTEIKKLKKLEKLKFQREEGNWLKEKREFREYQTDARNENARLRFEVGNRDLQIAQLRSENEQTHNLCLHYREMYDGSRNELIRRTEELEKVKVEKEHQTKGREVWEKEVIQQRQRIDSGRLSMQRCMDEALEMANQVESGTEAVIDMARFQEGISTLNNVEKRLRQFGMI